MGLGRAGSVRGQSDTPPGPESPKTPGNGSLGQILRDSGIARMGEGRGVAEKQAKVPRTDKLIWAARNFPCVLCAKHKMYTVAAHCNDVRAKGIGKKAPDWQVAYVCTACHDLIDGRAGGLSLAEKRRMWLEAHWLTVNLWFQHGLVAPV